MTLTEFDRVLVSHVHYPCDLMSLAQVMDVDSMLIDPFDDVLDQVTLVYLIFVTQQLGGS